MRQSRQLATKGHRSRQSCELTQTFISLRDIRALPLAEQMHGESVMTTSSSVCRRTELSECLEDLLPVGRAPGSRYVAC